MAGTKVLVSPIGMIMIHNPAMLAVGDSAEMQKAIDMLSEVKESIINAYEIKTGLTHRQIDTIFLEKYKPVFGTLFSDISLTSEA